MNQRDIIKAWKDPEARQAMAAQGLDVPRHPAGIIELPDHLLSETNGAGTETMLTLGCCNGFTSDASCGQEQTFGGCEMTLNVHC